MRKVAILGVFLILSSSIVYSQGLSTIDTVDQAIGLTTAQSETYWKELLAACSTSPVKYVNYGKLSAKEIQEKLGKEIEARKAGSSFFDYGIKFIDQNGSPNTWEPSLITSDGYLQFNSYQYKARISQYLASRSNPFILHEGFTMLDHDIEVFDDIELKKKAGTLRKGSVVSFTKWNMLKKSKMVEAFVFSNESKTLFFSSSEFPILIELFKATSYKVRDKKMIRSIAGKEMDTGLEISKNQKDQRYVEMLNNTFLKRLNVLFWELTGDYYFDDNGNFLRVGFEPYFGA